MKNLSDVDTIVQENLLLVNWHFKRSQQGNTIQYTVRESEDGVLIGIYRLSQWPNGNLKMSWTNKAPGDKKFIKMRDDFHFKMLMPLITALQDNTEKEAHIRTEGIDTPSSGRSVREMLETFSAFAAEPLRTDLSEFAKQLSSPTYEMIQELAKTLNVSENFAHMFGEPLTVSDEMFQQAQLDAGIDNIETKLGALIPEIKNNPPSSNISQAEKAALLSKMADMSAEMLMLRNKLEELGQSKKASSIKRGPNLETRRKIRELAQKREDEINRHKPINGWVNSCQVVQIDPQTARNNAPNLRANWNDTTYHWTEEMEGWGD
jgi:hypothetical protein